MPVSMAEKQSRSQAERDRLIVWIEDSLFLFLLVVYQSKGEISLAAELSVDLE